MADLRGSESARSLPATVVPGASAALAIAALWVELTAPTDKTYHLAPAVAAWMPGLIVGLRVRDRGDQLSDPKRLALLASAIGLASVVAGWVAIALPA